MRLLFKPFTAGWLLLVCLFFTSGQILAQKEANITADEFTPKGVTNAWAEGNISPNLNFNDLFNKKFSLYELLDKPTIIEVIPRDCNGCDRNLKYLKSFYKQFNINILTIHESEYRDQLIETARDNDVRWSIIQDDSEKFGQVPFSQQTQVSFILLTPDKKIYKVYKSPKEIGKLGVDLQQYFNQ